MPKEYDVVIIGAGQAGMFAAYELAKAQKKLDILLIDKGKDIKGRTKNSANKGNGYARGEAQDMMCGMGGAGTWSDGTLNLRPDIGGNLDQFTKNNNESWELIRYVDRVFLKHGAPTKVYKAKGKDAENLKRKAATVGVEFIDIEQRHIGSDNGPRVIEGFERTLEKLGVNFLMKTEVKDLLIEKNVCRGVILKGGKKISAKYVIMAPGRIGGEWIDGVFTNHKVEYSYGPLDVGVRVEVPSIVMDPIIKINRDPKFHIRTNKYDDFVRTFCLPPGELVIHRDDGVISIDPIEEVGGNTLSLDFETDNLVFKEPDVHTKRRYDGKIIKARLSNGGKIRVTEDHVLFVRDDVGEDEKKVMEILRNQSLRSVDIFKKTGILIHNVRQKILKKLLLLGCVKKTKKGKNVFYEFVKMPNWDFIPKRAGDIHLNEVIPTLNRVPRGEEISEINLAEYLKEVPKDELKGLYVRGAEGIVKRIAEEEGTTIERLIGDYQYKNLDFARFLRLGGRYNIPDKSLRSLRLGFSGSKVEFPLILPITKELARVLGYFVSEGNYNILKGGKHPTYNVVFTTGDVEIQEDLLLCMGKIGRDIHYSGIESGEKTPQFYFPSKLLYLLFRYVFAIPKGARNKRLPRFFFNTSKEISFEFLSALFDGDGHVGRDGAYYTTTSRVLRGQLSYLLLSLSYPTTHREIKNRGFAPTQKKEGLEELYVMVAGRRNQKRFAESLKPHRASNVRGKEELLARECGYERMVQIPNYVSRLYQDDRLGLAQIRDIKSEHYRGLVYDFSIPEYQNFVAGDKPMFIHNCTNHQGFVVKESYDGHIGVNGHSMTGKKSKNTNFAFLQRMQLTEPLENTTKYGKSIGKLATTIGGGKPIVQRMVDLFNGRRSTWSRINKNRIEPTLKDVTPGDISMAMPHRIVMNLIEGLEKLNEVIPGVVSDSTLLYAPEIKFYSTMTKVDGDMQTSVKNLFAAGDGCGLSRDITNAAATGVLAARGILKNLG